ncbi:MAG: mercury resistance system transport protein MerF [Proteobacteria bacterium]|nr:mercury resistance system transport protein MerF [Pseudomonadota bacterium]
MNDKTLLRTGIAGSAIVALCCVTPILVVAVSAIGLAAIVGWLDFVLFPALAFFLGLTAYALIRRRKSS